MDIHANGLLMSGDKILGTVKNGILISKEINNIAFLPMFFDKKDNVDSWLETRVIDKSRINSRKLKKALQLKNKDDVSTALYVYGASITDNYWIKPFDESQLLYSDIAFTKNSFDRLALDGSFSTFSYSTPERTPELTNIGSYEKCWRKIDGEWYLYKKGSAGDLFAEIFAYKIGKAMGYPMAEYEIDGIYIKSRDLTCGKYNLEPMAHIIGDNDNYTDNYQLITSYSPKLAREYVDMIIFDTLIFNTDRHTYNYGFLRNQETGEIISFSPNYDHNQAYGSSQTSFKLRPQEDLLLRFLSDFLKENKITATLPKLTVNQITNILEEIDLPVPEIKQAAGEFLPLRYEQPKLLPQVKVSKSHVR